MACLPLHSAARRPSLPHEVKVAYYLPTLVGQETIFPWKRLAAINRRVGKKALQRIDVATRALAGSADVFPANWWRDSQLPARICDKSEVWTDKTSSPAPTCASGIFLLDLGRHREPLCRLTCRSCGWHVC